MHSRHEMKVKVSLLVEVPEQLHEGLQVFLDTHPEWNQERVFASALSLFLMQNDGSNRAVNRIYVQTLLNFEA